MGSTIKMSSLNKDKLNKLLTPIVFCIDGNKVASLTKEYNILSVNEILSKRLLTYERYSRNLFVADELDKIIEKNGESLLIIDFEILFNPEYQLDVLKLFIIANRKKKIAVLWSGRYESGKLLFAEPGYIDYKSYNVNDYDISCII